MDEKRRNFRWQRPTEGAAGSESANWDVVVSGLRSWALTKPKSIYHFDYKIFSKRPIDQVHVLGDLSDIMRRKDDRAYQAWFLKIEREPNGAETIELHQADDDSEIDGIPDAGSTESAGAADEIVDVQDSSVAFLNAAAACAEALAEQSSRAAKRVAIPPHRAELILRFALPKEQREYLLGDLEEEFRSEMVPKFGYRVAARWYWVQVLKAVAAAFGARLRVWLGISALTSAVGWLVAKIGL